MGNVGKFQKTGKKNNTSILSLRLESTWHGFLFLTLYTYYIPVKHVQSYELYVCLSWQLGLPTFECSTTILDFIGLILRRNGVTAETAYFLTFRYSPSFNKLTICHSSACLKVIDKALVKYRLESHHHSACFNSRYKIHTHQDTEYKRCLTPPHYVLEIWRMYPLYLLR